MTINVWEMKWMLETFTWIQAARIKRTNGVQFNQDSSPLILFQHKKNTMRDLTVALKLWFYPSPHERHRNESHRHCYQQCRRRWTECCAHKSIHSYCIHIHLFLLIHLTQIWWVIFVKLPLFLVFFTYTFGCLFSGNIKDDINPLILRSWGMTVKFFIALEW